jgi:hypothetical protein
MTKMTDVHFPLLHITSASPSVAKMSREYLHYTVFSQP